MNDQDNDNDNEVPPVVLDAHRGMAAQKATDQRRNTSAIELDQEAIRQKRALLEQALFAAPAGTWPEAAARALYLLGIFAETPEAQDPRMKQLIRDVNDDFRRLGGTTP
jgi:hypothetical protein